MFTEAIRDLDQLLIYNPLNVSALKRRRDLLNRLGLRPEMARDDDRLVSLLIQERLAIPHHKL